MSKKLIYLVSFALVLSLVGANVALGDTIEIPVAAGSDDAEEDVGGSASFAIDLGSSDMELMYDNDPADPLDEQVVGLRFVDVQITKGETILSAAVRFDADDVDDSEHVGNAYVIIEGELSPNPGTFEETANNITARPRTTAKVQWISEPWPADGGSHQKALTADISSIIQEIVNQDGWAAGNALVLIFSQDPATPSVGHRECESFSGAGDNIDRIPTLIIEFGEALVVDEIWREAESADVMGASWRIGVDPSASGAKYIGSEDGDGNDNDTAPGAEWVAVYNFEAAGGVYKILFCGQERGSDSFWVRIPGATSQTHEDPDQPGTGWVRFNGFDAPSGWAWDEVHSNDHDNAVVNWTLPAGANTLEIAKREDGVWLDSFIITDNLYLDQATLALTPATAVSIGIANDADDAEQHLDDGRIDAGSSDLELPYEDGGNPPTDEQVIGVRYAVDLRQGTAVTSAYLEIQADKADKEGTLEPVNLIIEGELTLDAAPFEEVANNITDRPTTVTKVKWSIPPWTEIGAKFRSPDISSIIKEIVNQEGWSAGNGLVLILRDDKDNPSTGLREAEAGSGDDSAHLHLTAVIPMASDPVPDDGTEGVPVGTSLSWKPTATAVSHDVYFGTSSPPAFIGNQEATTYYPGPLELSTTYYWQIDEVEADGTILTGDIWSFTSGSYNLLVHKRIASESDDCEEDLNPSKLGENDLGSSDLEMPYEDTGMGDPQIIGVRFADIGIPAGSSIIDAWVRFQVDENKDGTLPVNLTVEGELTPNPVAFVGGGPGTFNISSRPRTVANVAWSVPNWDTVGAQGPDQTTPNLAPIIQELIDQPGWAAGNAVVTIFSDDPANPSEGIRCAEGGTGGDSALIHIEAISEAPTQPHPANGAENVPLDTTLSWWPGFGAVSHDGYIGTSSPPPFLGNTPEVSFDGAGLLEPSTTYYWQLNAVEADGTTHTGDIWSFTTEPGNATQPDPANNAVGVALDVILSWSPGITAATHDVYFGTSSPPAFIGNQAESSFDPGPLEMETTYYWQVDEIEADGTTVYTGDIWSFKTPRPGTGTILREVWEGIEGTSVSDLTGSADYPDNPTYSDEVTLFEAPIDFADNFGSRLHGYLHPETSGDYLFWIATDDNSELWLSTDESPANAALISYVTNWTDPRQFDDSDVVPSGSIHLEGGQKYYILALYKEGGGGDNCAVAWEGPDSPTRAVIHGYFLSPFVQLWASGPDPADGAILEGTFAILMWTSGVTAASHDVYIGDNFDNVNSGAEGTFVGNQSTTSLTVGSTGSPFPDGLAAGTTYYWRVDEVEADGTTTHKGGIWSFTVPPKTAYNPDPADGAVSVDTNVVLSWMAGLSAKLHSVYFGDNFDTVNNAVGAPLLPTTTYNPGPLELGKTYYWRVDEFDPPFTHKGEVWNFTTAGL